jgi:hypothetical protein
MNDYMTTRTVNLAERLAYSTETRGAMQPAFAEGDRLERLEALRCLSRDVLLRYTQNPEMMEAPPGVLAARAVVQAESLLAELERVEAGKEVTEEENMKHGVLFRMFREMFWRKQQGSGA